MSASVKDTFTGTAGTNLVAHTGETGATWAWNTAVTPVVADFLEIGNADFLRFQPTTLNAGDNGARKMAYASGGAPGGASTYDVVLRLRWKSFVTPGIQYVTPAARYSTTADSGYNFIINTSAGAGGLHSVILRQYTAGGTIQIGATFQTTFAVDTFYTFRLRVGSPTATTISVLLDNTLTAATGTNGAYDGVTQNAVGMVALTGVVGSDTTGLHVEAFEVVPVGENASWETPTISLAGDIGIPFSFAGTEGGSDPAAQTLTITNTGSGILSGLAVAKVGGAAWLTVGALSATSLAPGASATCSVTASLSGLTAAGSPYAETLRVTSSAAGVTNSPQDAAVTFSVASGTLVVGGPSYELTAVATRGGVTIYPRLTWTTDDSAVATVRPTGRLTALVTGVGVGSTTVRVRARNGLVAARVVTVEIAA